MFSFCFRTRYNELDPLILIKPECGVGEEWTWLDFHLYPVKPTFSVSVAKDQDTLYMLNLIKPDS
jgi:hypothetical protein